MTDAGVSFVVEGSPCFFAWLSFSRDVMVWACCDSVGVCGVG